MLFGLVRSLTNNRSYQHLKISIGEIFWNNGLLGFFQGPKPPMPRLPHETVTVLVRLVETSFFWWNMSNPYALVMTWGYWHVHLPPLLSKNPNQTIFRQIPVQSGLQSNWPPQRKGIGFKELNSQNWSPHINFEIQNDSFMMFYG